MKTRRSLGKVHTARKKSASKKRNLPGTPDDWAEHWQKAADFYDSPESITVLANGRPVSTAEARRILGRGASKSISVRFPILDVDALRRIAKVRNEKYQRLIIRAVEKYIDEEERELFSDSSPKKKAVQSAG